MAGDTGSRATPAAAGGHDAEGSDEGDATRRQAFSAATKRALVDVAQELFAARGYAATSLDAITAGAQVTKGALYHHFSGKQAVFEAALERVQIDAAGLITASMRSTADPWTRARAGLAAFLAIVEQPDYRRIVVQDGPAVLGWDRFREQEERTTFAIVTDITRSVVAAGSWQIDEATLTTFARVFFGAMSAAGESVTAAGDPAAEAQRVEAVVATLVAGLQMLADSRTGDRPARCS